MNLILLKYSLNSVLEISISNHLMVTMMIIRVYFFATIM